MNPSTNPSALRSKAEITEALLQIMNEYNFSEITVKHILAEAHVARKTFYRNFASKEDVLKSYIDSLILDYVDKLIELAKSPNASKNSNLFPENILRLIFSICLENRDFLICLYKNDLMHVLLQQMNAAISKVHTQVVPNDHYIFSGISPELTDYIISFNVSAIWGTINRWVERGMNDDPEVIIENLGHFLYNFISSGK